jgi:beta-N-acetylhexosaminidase
MRFVSLLLIIFVLSGCAYTEIPDTSSVTQPSLTEPTVYTAPTQTTAPSTAPTSAPPTEPTFDPYALIDSMSPEALIGQLFLVRCPDTGAIEDIEQYQPGGFVLFGRDFADKSPDTVQQTIADYQTASTIPLLIATDEEGGTVTRVSSHSQYRSSRFPSPRNLYASGGLELILETELEKCRLLSDLGVNVNLAPVCDITDDPEAFMYSRSLGESPAITGAFAAELCALMTQEGIGSVLKHFPGYGNNRDTHTGIARDSRPLTQLETQDLIPFRAGIAADCDAILVSHTIVEAFDPELPASLSPAVTSYLRKNLGFNGVILTDDLIMEAITDLYGAEEAAVLAVLAGCDMLCSSEHPVQYSAVLEAFLTGRIPETQIRESVARILLWKHKLGLLPD